MSLQIGDKVRVILGSLNEAQIKWAEADTSGEKLKIKFKDGHTMNVFEYELLSSKDPELDRIAKVWETLQSKGWMHISVVKKTGDPKLYHKAFRTVNEVIKFKKECGAKSTSKIKYQVVAEH